MANYRYGGGSGSLPPVIKGLLIINVAAYIAQVTFLPGLTEWGALHYWSSNLFKPHQIITMMFLHDPSSFWHLGFNMLTLWMFGTILENYWGSKRFLNFYMICGIGASVVTLLSVPFSASQFVHHHPEYLQSGDVFSQVVEQYKEQYSAIGASGAIMGVMAAYAYLFPNTELYLYFAIPVKAKYAIPCFILYDLVSGLGIGIKGDNVAHFAHLGGALIGLLLVLIWNKTNRKNFY